MELTVGRKVGGIAAIILVLAALLYFFWPSGGSQGGLESDPAQSEAFLQSVLADLPEAERAKLQSQLDVMKAGSENSLQEALDKKDYPALAEIAQMASESKAKLLVVWPKILSGDYSQDELKAEKDRLAMQRGLGAVDVDESGVVLGSAQNVAEIVQGVIAGNRPITAATDKARIVQAFMILNASYDRARKSSPVVVEALARFGKLPKDRQSATSPRQIASNILDLEPCFGATGKEVASGKDLNIMGITLGMSEDQVKQAICVAENQPVLRPNISYNTDKSAYCLNCKDDIRGDPFDLVRFSGGGIERLKKFESIVMAPDRSGGPDTMQREVTPVALNTVFAAYVKNFGQPNYSFRNDEYLTFAWVLKRDGKPFAPNHWTGRFADAKMSGAPVILGNVDLGRQKVNLGKLKPQATYCVANIPMEGGTQAIGLPLNSAYWEVSEAERLQSADRQHWNRIGSQIDQLVDPEVASKIQRQELPIVDPAGKTDECGKVLFIRVKMDDGYRLTGSGREENIPQGIGNAPGDDVIKAVASTLAVKSVWSGLYDVGALLRGTQAAEAQKRAAEAKARQSSQQQGAAQAEGFRP